MGVPAHRGGPVVGFDPAALSAQVTRYVGIAEKNIALLEKMGTPLADLVKAEMEAKSLDAESTSIIWDRLVKAGLNLVKATDELSRLTSFLSGGPDTRPDLSSLSEVDLRGILVVAIKALGVTEVQKLLAEV